MVTKNYKLYNSDLTSNVALISKDNVLNKNYLIESTSFLFSGYYNTFNKRFKYTFRILDMKKNLITNDIHTKYFNDLKTIFERNIYLFKFMRKMLTFNPLSVTGILRQKINDVFAKQNEINYISGKISPFRNLTLHVNRKNNSFKELNLYKLIPMITKNLFFQSFKVVATILKKIAIFITYKIRRRWLKTYFMGFKLNIKNKLRFKYKRIVRRNVIFFQKNTKHLQSFLKNKFLRENKFIKKFKLKKVKNKLKINFPKIISA